MIQHRRSLRALRILRATLVHISIWVALGLVASSQSLLVYAANGDPLAVGLVLRYGMPLWLAWAALSPIVIVVTRRWPIQRIGWATWIPLHLALGVVAWIGTTAASLAIRNSAIWNAPSGRTFTQDAASTLTTSVLLYVLIVGSVRVREYLSELRARDLAEAEVREQLADARLDALRAQVNPHFLFNTMHAIAAQIRADPRAAEDMLADLADLIRLSLDGQGTSVVPLSEELEFVERYLAIQSVRFGDRLEIALAVPEELLGVMVPSLILQPVVENAIEHGISNIREGGRVEIAVAVSGPELEIRVAGDGPQVATEELAPDRWRIGLGNTRSRIRTMYGDGFGVDAVRRAEGGVTVTLRLPLHRGAADEPRRNTGGHPSEGDRREGR